MPKKHLNREQREQAVMEVLLAMADEGLKPELTAYGLAKRMDIVVSQPLYAVLSDMVARGRLTVRDEVIVNRCERTWYSLPEGTYQLGGTRTLRINGRVWSRRELLF
jgi:hypothetical protein